MIVVDNDVISYFWIRMDADRAALAQDVRARDPGWVAPRVWRSEFRNVLRGYMAGDYMTLAEAVEYAQMAEEDLHGSTRPVPTPQVLQLVDETDHSAYDCEYVALAQELGVPLVTGDRDVADLFPETAVLLEDYAAG
ncbi:type II toxin-antitoxin system VapC family toxin [Salinibacter ruber]|jgi:predicted nucleic acid-binding protein|uniref:Nucleic acid-binding protein n=2 Tax=Salinibacter ruber TaxID=146919 RepID=A0AAW5PBG5_9BACT|nr:type II toxin-antitoxin system VapC family toxin [Salinibacter ruber]MCS3665760.1 putative nucleic acid-binding protein [Salinibacter ruber]MCS3956435.1 putative nucleic acid-binding protein [Salinibacter ruber]MCS4159536.1 putative nucleic acid-binding protein [Salinibacter ruber]MCS4181626.1 putative nucleic acid-binding protein [Salinibacter ruber]MCS4223874.1 putative nucleic acid-binding protein [Salinibacter ruber]